MIKFLFIHSLLSDPRYVASIFISFKGIRVGNLSHPEIKAASIYNVTHLLYIRILSSYLGNSIIPFVEILVYKYWTNQSRTTNCLRWKTRITRGSRFRLTKDDEGSTWRQHWFNRVNARVLELYRVWGTYPVSTRIKETYLEFWHLWPDVVVNQTSPRSCGTRL